MDERIKNPTTHAEEKALLGYILFDNNCYHEVKHFLRPEDFQDPRHRKIYEAMLELFNSGSFVDPLVIANWLDDGAGSLRQVGGSAYIAEIAAFISPRLGTPVH